MASDLFFHSFNMNIPQRRASVPGKITTYSSRKMEIHDEEPPFPLLHLPGDLLREVALWIAKDEIVGRCALMNLRLVHPFFQGLVDPMVFQSIHLKVAGAPNASQVIADMKRLLLEPAYGHIRAIVRTLVLDIHIPGPMTHGRSQDNGAQILIDFLALHSREIVDALADISQFPHLVDFHLKLYFGKLSRKQPLVDLLQVYSILYELKKVREKLMVRADLNVDKGNEGTDIVPTLYIATLPPLDYLGIQQRWQDPATISALVAVIERSPDLRELEISRSYAFWERDTVPLSLAALINRLSSSSPSLSHLESLKLRCEDHLFIWTEDVNRFRALRRLQVENFSSDGTPRQSSFPWHELLRQGIQLESVQVTGLDDDLVDYLTNMLPNRLQRLKVTFENNALQFQSNDNYSILRYHAVTYGDDNDQRHNLDLATRFWKAIKRSEGSLTYLSVKPWLNADGEGWGEEGNVLEHVREYVRVNSYAPWSPTSQEFANAEISFASLEEIEVPTAVMCPEDLKFFPSKKRAQIKAVKTNPCKFRFDILMDSLTGCLNSLHSIRLINFGGLMRYRPRYGSGRERSAQLEDAGANNVEWLVDVSKAIPNVMIPAIERYTVDDGLGKSAAGTRLWVIPAGAKYKKQTRFLLERDRRWRLKEKQPPGDIYFHAQTKVSFNASALSC